MCDSLLEFNNPGKAFALPGPVLIRLPVLIGLLQPLVCPAIYKDGLSGDEGSAF